MTFIHELTRRSIVVERAAVRYGHLKTEIGLLFFIEEHSRSKGYETVVELREMKYIGMVAEHCERYSDMQRIQIQLQLLSCFWVGKRSPVLTFDLLVALIDSQDGELCPIPLYPSSPCYSGSVTSREV